VRQWGMTTCVPRAGPLQELRPIASSLPGLLVSDILAAPFACVAVCVAVCDAVCFVVFTSI